jgi:hypothetical protein
MMWAGLLPRHHGCRLDRIRLPEAPKNIPTPCTKLIAALGTGTAASPRSRLTASVIANIPVHAGVGVGKAAAVGVHRQLAAVAGVSLGDERAGLPAADAPNEPTSSICDMTGASHASPEPSR